MPFEETLYVNGRVFTGRPSAPWADSIGVQGERVRATGHREEVGRVLRPDARVVDLGGRLTVPGFVDAHNHYFATAEDLASVDVRYPAVGTIEDLVEALRQRAERTPAGRWVRGFGLDDAKFPGDRRPSRVDLDRATGDHPVAVNHVSGHHVLVNSMALALRGLDQRAADPPGGRLVRDAGGRLTGWCLDAAMNLVLPVAVDVGSHGPNFHTEVALDEAVDLLAAAARAYHAAGLTTVCDPQVTRRELTIYREAHAARRLGVRVSCMLLSHQLEAVRAIGLAGPFGDEALRIHGMKFYADGSLIGGTAAFSEPYGESGEFLGSTYWTADRLSALIGEAHGAGWQVGIHAQGDRAIGMSLDAIAAALGARPMADARPRLEHAGYPTPEQVVRMRDLGVITVNQPSYLHDSGDEFLKRLGPRAHRLQPWREELDAGVGVVLSSDALVASYRPLDTIAAAIERRTRLGAAIGVEQALTVEEAIRAHTIDAARAIGMESLIGSIEAGKLADFVV
ncbi:MAG TPA: amidohydrolase, partial [Candidatus Dormibacteraeota bacterium]|nr:amidohydrolase [Candidatus Dormibacteraeota bacterium]